MGLIKQNNTSEKKRLLVFHPALAPYRIDFFNSLHESFDASFYFLYVDALEQSFNQEELIKRLYFKPHYLSGAALGIKNLRLDVFSILHNQKPDIVFCSEYNILGVLVLLYKKLYNPKLKVFTICDDSKEMALTAGAKQKCVRDKLVKRFDGVILANEEVTKWYRETYNTKQKFIYFPIIQEDYEFRRRLEETLPLTKQLAEEYNLSNKQIVLYVGRLAAVKNLKILIHSFHAVVHKFPQVVLIMVGEGDELISLQQEIKKLGLEKNILFAGKKQGSELCAYYNLGQLFVLPSSYEPFGAVVNEALLSGCYTLCSAVAGSAGLIRKGDNGDIFDPKSVTGLTTKIESALLRCAPLGDIEVKPNRMIQSYREYFNRFIDQVNNIAR